MNTQPPDAASMAAAVAYAAGVRNEGDLRICVAIGGAESGWNSTAVGDVSLEDDTWGPSVGIWQIRTLRDQYGTGQARDESKLTDPVFNAKAMWEISGGASNWRPWSTYTNGAYRDYLDAGQTAARWAIANMGDGTLPAGLSFASAGTAATTAADAVTGGSFSTLTKLADLVGSILPTITNPKMWLRGGLISGGAFLVALGLAQVVRPDASTIGKAAGVVL